IAQAQVGTAPLGGGEFLLSYPLDNPSRPRLLYLLSFPSFEFHVVRILMTHHVFFLLLLCVLLFSLARLCFLGWSHHGPAQSRTAAKRTSLHRLRHRHAPHLIAPLVASPASPRRVEVHRLCLCGPGAR